MIFQKKFNSFEILFCSNQNLGKTIAYAVKIQKLKEQSLTLQTVSATRFIHFHNGEKKCNMNRFCSLRRESQWTWFVVFPMCQRAAYRRKAIITNVSCWNFAENEIRECRKGEISIRMQMRGSVAGVRVKHGKVQCCDQWRERFWYEAPSKQATQVRSNANDKFESRSFSPDYLRRK